MYSAELWPGRVVCLIIAYYFSFYHNFIDSCTVQSYGQVVSCVSLLLIALVFIIILSTPVQCRAMAGH